MPENNENVFELIEATVINGVFFGLHLVHDAEEVRQKEKLGIKKELDVDYSPIAIVCDKIETFRPNIQRISDDEAIAVTDVFTTAEDFVVAIDFDRFTALYMQWRKSL